MKVRTEIPIEELRKKKLLIATPMYGGNCNGLYSRSMLNLAVTLVRYGIEFQYFTLFNESLITRARNYCADTFMRGDYTHMLFIDADVGFKPDDVIQLLGLQDHEADDDADVVCAPYPKKSISWEKIKRAVDLGIADEDPMELGKYVGDYVFNMKPGVKTISLVEPLEVTEAGTGFMMIRRKTFEKYLEAYPELAYLPDHPRSEHFDGTREIHAFFDCVIDPETRRYLSEDYMFCQNVGKMGMKIWICPWMELSHVGTYTFSGSPARLLSIGASTTVDKNALTVR